MIIFFWIDAFVCPIFVPWYNDVSIKRDSLPSNNIVDFPLMDKLNENRTLKRHPEEFLCIVGLIRSFVDTGIRPTLLDPDKNDGYMGLLDFMKSTDPFKVKVGERTLAEGEKRKVGFSVGLLPVKKARTNGVVIYEHVSTTDGKTPAAMEKLITRSGQPATGAGSAASNAKEFVSSSITPTPEHDCQDESIFAHDDNVASPVPSVQVDADVVATGPVNEARETMAATKLEELTGLSVQNTELLGQVFGLESVCDGLKEKVVKLESEYECLKGKVEGEAKLKEKFMAIQDVKIQRLAEHGSDLDARLSKISYQVDSELYPHMLIVVAGHRWVIGHDLRLAFMKCCQSLDYQTALAKVISLAID
ncbi:hypothetical protein Tco_0560559 [Tanacetum coccineum]